ncbi:MAG: phosphatase PAP2 family protein [Promethearchaeota archaeon]
MNEKNDQNLSLEKITSNKPKIGFIIGLNIVAIIFVIIMTWIFRLEGFVYNPNTSSFEKIKGALDIAVTNTFYDRNLNDWILKDNLLIYFFNEYDTIITVVLILIGFMLIILGKKKQNEMIVKYGVFILLSMAIAAGITINIIFKGLWGRWRPRQTFYFGDTHDFYAVWEPAWLLDPSSIGNGVSFPSGHVSATTSYIALFFVFLNPQIIAYIFAKGRPSAKLIKLCETIKWMAFGMATAGSVIMAFSRISVGAHFLSDTFYSFVFVYFITEILYYALKIPKHEREFIKTLKTE